LATQEHQKSTISAEDSSLPPDFLKTYFPFSES